MVEITEKAAEGLKAMMEEEDKKDHALRVFIAGMGCSGTQYGLTLDNEQADDDIVLESNGIKIYITEDVKTALEGAKVDFVDTPQGSGYVIDNPNAPKCGGSCCG